MAIHRMEGMISASTIEQYIRSAERPIWPTLCKRETRLSYVSKALFRRERAFFSQCIPNTLVLDKNNHNNTSKYAPLRLS